MKREETRREVWLWNGGSDSEGLAVGSSGLIEVGCWIILSGRDRSGNTAGVQLHKLKTNTHTHTALRTDLGFSLSCNSDCSSQPVTQVYLWLSSFSPSTNINTVFSGNCWQLWCSHRVKKQSEKRESRNTPQRVMEKVWKRQTRRSARSALRNKAEKHWDLSSKQIMSNYNTFHCL